MSLSNLELLEIEFMIKDKRCKEVLEMKIGGCEKLYRLSKIFGDVVVNNVSDNYIKGVSELFYCNSNCENFEEC